MRGPDETARRHAGLPAACVSAAARRTDDGEAGDPEQFAHAFSSQVLSLEKAF
jgi:hypothetical protein